MPWLERTALVLVVGGSLACADVIELGPDSGTGTDTDALPPWGETGEGPPPMEPVCGDGLLDTGEECDPGAGGASATCAEDCQVVDAWTRSLDGGLHRDDIAGGVAALPDGNLAIAGIKDDADGRSRSWVGIMTPGGELVREHVHDLSAVVGTGSWESAGAVAPTSDGGLVLTGTVELDGDNTHVGWVRRLDADLAEVWLVLQPAGANTFLYALTVTDSDHVYAAGLLSDGGWDGFVWALEPDGGTVWTRVLDGPAGLDERVRGVAHDGTQLVLVGERDTEAGLQGVWIEARDADGDALWSVLDLGPGAVGYTGARAVTIGPEGDLLITGHRTGSLWLARYSRDGQELWSDTWRSPHGEGDWGTAIAAAPDGRILTVGATVVPGEQWHFLAILWHQGLVQWADGHGGEAGLRDLATGAWIDPAGAPYLIGRETVIGEGENLFVRKYGGW